MNRLLFKSLLGATFLSMAVVGTANAGGFGRGSADTDIIYEDGNFNMRSSVTYVHPTRKFKTNANPQLNGSDYAADYMVPSFAIKLNVTDNFRCAGTHVMNNGGNAVYEFPTISGKLSEEFTTYKSALTCGVKFDVGRGNFWLLGGAFLEKFDYTRINVVGDLPGDVALSNAVLALDGDDTGYRLGVAYEIKEIAFRAQLLYRSGTKYGADGSLTVPTGALLGSQAAALQQQAQALANAGQFVQAQQVAAQAQAVLGQAYAAAAANLRSALPAIGTGDLPQSIELKLQSGIAPGWLAFGAIKWTDWSETKQLIAEAFTPLGTTINSTNDYFWKDGWTFTAGVGHQFNDSVSGLVALTYDQGVATGWDLISDSWTLSAGTLLKDKLGGELRLGGGLTYIGSAEETKYAVGENSSADSGWAVAGSIGYSIKW
ncbi:MAG: outer membrane protein transport protein [Mesorhizobium sp.]